MRYLYALTIFISAFLLFQVQPLIGRYILPWFGSSPGVWTSCLVFFQVMLLGGYLYAHLIATFLSRISQIRLHASLLVISLLLLPIIPSADWRTTDDIDPAFRILLLLAATVGFPYLLLSSTAPLLQKWFSNQIADSRPYRLYAVSNAGSLLALISYPFIFERYLRLHSQAWLWSGGFIGFVILVVLIASYYSKEHTSLPNAAEDHDPENPIIASQPRANKEDTSPSPAWGRIALWFSLSALGSVMLVATTNRISQDVPAVPFLFVLLLGLYLLTFIVAFEGTRWYDRPLFSVLLFVAIGAACYELFQGTDLALNHRIIIFGLVLFASCTCCHGELARLKPSSRHLTLFYLILALGGASGGVLTALIAPYLFNRFWEYEIGIFSSFSLVMFIILRDLFVTSRAQRKKRTSQLASGRFQPVWLATTSVIVGGATLTVVLGKHVQSERNNLIAQDRSFYGVLRVVELDKGVHSAHRRKLIHGSITHGIQMQPPSLRDAKTAYFSSRSGIGMAIILHPNRRRPSYPFRIGVVGLGAGTIAGYANDPLSGYQANSGINDSIQFYEIDPLVVQFANDYFTFLKDAKSRGAEVTVPIGDARIVMERELETGNANPYDVLAIDAFTGDAIPMHLLTKECYEIYLRHLKPDGILAFHISSLYFDLIPVIKALAAEHGQQILLVRQEADNHGSLKNQWALVTNNESFSNHKLVVANLSKIGDQAGILWTDDFGNLLDVIR